MQPSSLQVGTIASRWRDDRGDEIESTPKTEKRVIVLKQESVIEIILIPLKGAGNECLRNRRCLL